MIRRGTPVQTWRSLLAGLYADRAEDCLNRLLERVAHPALPRSGAHPVWDQRDVMLICYADQIQSPGQPHLRTLRQFLTRQRLPRLIRRLHLLPFFPSSSDDGFAVSDYRAVEPSLGTWDDVQELGRQFTLMFDLVVNHVSASSQWFQQYLQGTPPYDRFFVEADPAADLSQVVRPRSLPLLTPVPTPDGIRHVWTTFSPDQVDLNYGNPRVLLEMIDVLLFYLQHGARMLRLDAVAYLWKQLGTPCIHLRQTHLVVKLLRAVVDAVAPGTWLVSETNVPHRENVSYFGAGDEAHLVYQFSLPPLLLEALVSGDATALRDWLGHLEATSAGAAYLNFTASHDGIGVRPLEGLLSGARIERLIDTVRQRGGQVSTRRTAEGRDSPYELNISYWDALGDPGAGHPELQLRRFLASQAVLLALRGIPAVYFHSLVGTPNDHAGVAATGRARSINRRKFGADELAAVLGDPQSLAAQVFAAYRDLLARRIAQPAFHPDAQQEVWMDTDPAILAFVRTVPGQQQILVAANVGREPRSVRLPAGHDDAAMQDLVTGQPAPVAAGQLALQPYQVVWLDRGAVSVDRMKGACRPPRKPKT